MVKSMDSLTDPDLIGEYHGLTDMPGRVKIWSFTRDTLSEALEVVERNNARPITPRDFTQIAYREADQPTSRRLSEFAYAGSAAIVVVPGKEAFLLRRAPWENRGFARQANDYLEGNSRKPFDYHSIAETAEGEASFAPEKASVLRLPGETRAVEIPCAHFDRDPITRFLYQESAGEVGEWFRRIGGKRTMPFHPGKTTDDAPGTPPYVTPLIHLPPRAWGNPRPLIEEEVINLVAISSLE